MFYLDVSVEETVRRHATRPLASEVAPEQMLGWYESYDVLGIPGEHIIAESSSFEETVAYILDASRLPAATATTYCPAICPQCRAEQAPPPRRPRRDPVVR